MKQTVYAKIEEIYSEMVEVRRYLHMHPELSFQETETAKFIADYQRKLGLEVRENVGGNGVVATLEGGKPGKTIAIRADFDALPIQEENDVPYKSKTDGVMHACGHDAHTAIALGMAKAFTSVKDQLEGNLVFIHQHAEEVDPGGAKSMIEAGALDGVDVLFATHMENYIPVDHILHNDEYVLGACDDFKIKITGTGGHAAFPHDTIDVVATAAQLVNQLQQVISRKVDPLKSAVVTVGAMHAGDAANIIPGEACIEGTARMFDEEVRRDIQRWIEQITSHTCQAFGAEYELQYDYGYPATKNDQAINQLLLMEAKEIIPEDNIIEMNPNMGTEDASYFLQQVPGVYFFTGSANEKKGFVYPYHHAKFDIDEKALLNAAKMMSGAALRYLELNNA